MQVYCNNKFDHIKDPGCYVASTLLTTPIKLSFECGGSNCCGQIDNFGGPEATLMSCAWDNSHTTIHGRNFKKIMKYVIAGNAGMGYQWLPHIGITHRMFLMHSTSVLVYDASVVWFWSEVWINILYLWLSLTGDYTQLTQGIWLNHCLTLINICPWSSHIPHNVVGIHRRFQ